MELLKLMSHFLSGLPLVTNSALWSYISKHSKLFVKEFDLRTHLWPHALLRVLAKGLVRPPSSSA